MCGQWSTTGYVKNQINNRLENELSAEQYEQTLNELSKFKPAIILCGGEILLYPQWQKFMKMLTERDMPMTLITNGTHLRQAAETLVELGLNQLIVSIDGPAPVHDKIRGREGAFNRAIAGIKKVAAIKKEAGIKYPLISLNSTILADNWDSLDKIADLADKLQIDKVTYLHPNFLDKNLWQQHLQVFSSKIGDLSAEWGGFIRSMSDYDADKLAAKIEYIKKQKYSSLITFLPDFSADDIKKYYQDGLFQSKRFSQKCLGPWKTVNIHPDGKVSPCLGYSIGNILDKPFKEIWRGEKMRDFRQVVSEDMPFPACSRCCTFYRF